MRFIAIIAVALAVVVALVFLVPQIFRPDMSGLDTKTHSIEVAGFYGRGDFAGELLESDLIVTNVSAGNMSQSIQFKGAVCPRIQGLGRVFLDGSRVNEPDAIYKVYVNGVLQFSHNMELGGASVLTACLLLTQKDFIIQGQTIGSVKVELVVYVFEFARGAGAYEVLAYDKAVLT